MNENGQLTNIAEDATINLRAKKSDEVNDIIERMPVRFGFWALAIIILIVVLLFTFGWIIQYPDIVSGQVTINAKSSPIRLVANASGKLSLFTKKTRAIVKEGDYIGFLQNSAKTTDLQSLKSRLNDFDIHSASFDHYRTFFSEKLILGELNVRYYAFLTALYQYIDYREYNIFEKQQDILNKFSLNKRTMLEQNYKELTIKKNKLDLAVKAYNRDSVLNKGKVLAEAELENSRMNRLTFQENYTSINKEITTTQYQIEEARNQLQQLKINRFEKEKAMRLGLQNSYYALMDEINQWEQKYVFKSPMNGVVEFMKFWHQDEFVAAGTEVFTVIPKKNDIIGQLFLPEKGSGKVKVGQDVIIKMDNYPYVEYGFIKGKIKDISLITNTQQVSAQEKSASYLVLIDLPNGLKTNYGDKLDFKFEIKGTAEIITKDRRLINRIFDNLKYVISSKN